MANREKVGTKAGKNIYAKKWEVEDRNNPVISWYTSNRIWRKVEDNRVSNEKLLVARNNKIYRKIYKRLQYMLKNEE